MDVPSVLLEALQGEWKASRGEAVVVKGTEISINGRTMPGGLKFSDDGLRVIGFSIYTVQPGIPPEGQVMWHAGPQEIIWHRAGAGEVEGSIERMSSAITNQGSGLAASTLGHGASEHAMVVRLNAVIEQWREGPLVSVRSCDICPDWTNRSETGLSVDHVHYIANRIATEGFKCRRHFSTSGHWCAAEAGAHDVPVLIRERADSVLGQGALAKWREKTAENPAFPPFLLGGRKRFYCSLGNGHFSQALNLFRTGTVGLWTDRPYKIGHDEALLEALDEGVDSVVLSCDMPILDRKFVSEMLNRAHGRVWQVGDDGHVEIEGDSPDASASQFVALSKVLDSDELSCLVRLKVRVHPDGAPAGDASDDRRSRL